jgi:hypothetical protein
MARARRTTGYEAADDNNEVDGKSATGDGAAGDYGADDDYGDG